MRRDPDEEFWAFALVLVAFVLACCVFYLIWI